jgi:hypothetical protein
LVENIDQNSSFLRWKVASAIAHALTRFGLSTFVVEPSLDTAHRS